MWCIWIYSLNWFSVTPQRFTNAFSPFFYSSCSHSWCCLLCNTRYGKYNPTSMMGIWLIQIIITWFTQSMYKGCMGYGMCQWKDRTPPPPPITWRGLEQRRSEVEQRQGDLTNTMKHIFQISAYSSQPRAPTRREVRGFKLKLKNSLIYICSLFDRNEFSFESVFVQSVCSELSMHLL